MGSFFNRKIIAILFSCFTIIGFGTSNVSAEVPVKPFQDGAKVVFLGDSITHNGFYHPYIYHFYNTRFPDRDITFINGGLSSGKTTDALVRLNWDILSHNPTDIVINLGMNDVGTSQFTDRERSNEERNKANLKFINRYKENMIEILDRIAAAGNINVTLIIPTPYDAYVKTERDPAIGKNVMIRVLGQFLIDEGRQRGIPVVDFNTLIRDINLEKQKTDPTFTLVSPDRVHPRKPGHLICAYTFLKAQDLDGPISQTIIDVPTLSYKAVSATVENISKVPDGISFVLSEKSLPFFVDSKPESSDRPSAEPALEFVPFHRDFNTQMLRVTGLAEGTYAVKINTTVIGKYTSQQLEAGIDTNAADEKTPQYKKSEDLQRHNELRWKAEREYRAIQWAAAMVLAPAGISNHYDERAIPAVVEFMNREDTTDGKKKYLQMWLENHSPKKISEILDSVNEYNELIKRDSKPLRYVYMIKKVN